MKIAPSMARFGVLLIGFLAGCQVAPEQTILLSKKSPVELRAIQSRAFETGDRNAILRAIIATLQDLGYNLDRVDASSGTVTATKLAMLKMTASAYPHGDEQTVVRANAVVTMQPHAQQVDAAEFYQKDFFEPLSKSLFLQAEAAPEGGAPPSQAPSAALTPDMPVAPRATPTS